MPNQIYKSTPRPQQEMPLVNIIIGHESYDLHVCTMNQQINWSD